MCLYSRAGRPTVQHSASIYIYSDVVVLSGRVRMQRPRNRFHTYTLVYSWVCVCVCVCSLRAFIYIGTSARGGITFVCVICIYIYMYVCWPVQRASRRRVFGSLTNFFPVLSIIIIIRLCTSRVYSAPYVSRIHIIDMYIDRFRFWYIIYSYILYARMHANIIWSPLDHTYYYCCCY